MDRKPPYRFIAIEGNIGAGKTSICKKISSTFNSKLVLEQFSDNPFLPLFYQDQERYAMAVELYFLTERQKQLTKEMAQMDLFHDFAISDYVLTKSLLFARNNLNEQEYKLYQRVFESLYLPNIKPDIIIYLHRSVEKLYHHIKVRGREYEQDIQPEYLLSIQEAYFEYFRYETGFPIVIINSENLDFLNNENHYEQLINILTQKFTPGLHQMSFVF
jgi:deoxyadenosine/deoxycytidine kinase